MIKEIITTILVGIASIFGISDNKIANLGAFSDPFLSVQLATGPSNNYCLKTDGTNNLWSSSCGTGGTGGSSVGWASTTADINSIYFTGGSTGNVGIGTTSPSTKLVLSGSSNVTTLSTLDTATTLSIENTDTTNNNLGTLAFRTNDVNGTLASGVHLESVFTSHAASAVSADFLIQTRNAGSLTEKLRVTGAGNVGIGTSTPSTKLQVYAGASGGSFDSTANIASESNTGNLIQLLAGASSVTGLAMGDSGNGFSGYLRYNNSDDSMQLWTAGTNNMTINSSGYVGIGTSSPALQEGGASGDKVLVVSSIGTTNRAADIELAGFSNSAGIGNAAGRLTFTRSGDALARIAGYRTATATDAGQLSFLTAASGAGLTEKMVIDPSGLVGIGTTTPYAKLAITNTGTSPSFVVEDSTSPDTTPFIVDASGLVGIGTPSPVRALDVQAPTAVIQALSTDGTSYASFLANNTGGNFYFARERSTGGLLGTGSTGYAGIISAAGTYPIQFAVNNAVTMTLLSGGNVGIGSTSPYASLSITNTGSGPSFVVEDSTSPDTTPFVIDASGNVGVQNASPSAKIDVAETSSFPKSMIAFRKPGSGDWGITLGSESVANVYIGLAGSATDYFWRANWNTANVAANTFQSPQGSDNAIVVAELLQKRAGNTGDYLHVTSSGGTAGNIFNIENSGKVGIGSTTPWAQLSVNPNGITGPSFVIGSSTATNFIVTNGGNVGIGTQAPGTLGKVEIADTGSTAYGQYLTKIVSNAATYSSALNSVFTSNQTSAAFGGINAGIYGQSFIGGSNTQNWNGTGGNESTSGAVAVVGRVEGRIGWAGTVTNASSFLASNESSPTGGGVITNLAGFRMLDAAGTGTITNQYGLYINNLTRGSTSNYGVYQAGTSNLNYFGGSVGIGSTSPYASLAITNTGTSPSFVVEDSTSPDTTPFIIDASGKVGIGTSTPSNALDVYSGNVVVRSGNEIRAYDTTNVMTLQISQISTDARFANGYGQINLAASTNVNLQTFYNSQYNTDFTLQNGGKIGIGTTTPTAVLHLKAGTATANTAPLKFTAGTNLTTPEAGAMEWDGTNLFITQTAGATRRTIAYTSDLTAGYVPYTGANANLNLGAYSLTATGITNSSMTLGSILFAGTAGVMSQDNANFFWDDTNNRLGIGTASPGAALHVNGSVILQTGSGTQVSARGLNANYFSSSQTLSLYAGSAGDVVLGPGSDVITIKSSGNVGIGTMGPGAKLEVAKGSVGDYLIIGGDNANNARSLKFTSGTVTNNGDLHTIQAQSVTGEIAFANGIGEKLRINKDGNVGIGTTSPYATLSVVGNVVAANFSATSTTATSTFAGGVDFGSGNFTYDTYTGVTSINSLQTGNMNFETDAGQVSWADMALSSTPSDTPVGYTAFLNGSSTISVYGLSAGNGWLKDDYPRVAIGSTTAPSSKLTVFGNGTGTNGTFEVVNSASTTLMKILDNGSVGIASTSPWKTFSVNGTVAMNGLTSSATGNALCITTSKEITDAGGASCTPSSIRFKENVSPMQTGYALDLLSKLSIVDFDYIEKQQYETNHSYGMIAEDVEKIDKNLVDYGYDGKPVSLHFEKITGLLVQAVQEQEGKIGDISSTTSRLDLTSSQLVASNALNITNLNSKIDVLNDMVANLNASTTLIAKLASSTADMLASSTETSLLNSTSFMDKIFLSFMNYLTTAMTKVKGIFVNEIHIEDKLCVDDVCINKDQLKTLIIQATASSTNNTNNNPVNIPTVPNNNPVVTLPPATPDNGTTTQTQATSTTVTNNNVTPTPQTTETPTTTPVTENPIPAPTPVVESTPVVETTPTAPVTESAPAPAPAGESAPQS